MTETSVDLQEKIRAHYAQAARSVAQSGPTSSPLSCCGPSQTSASTGLMRDGDHELDLGPQQTSASTELETTFGSALYDTVTTGDLPDKAILASLGCGNPTAVADLREGERVLDLGSGGGIDVLLSARRVGPTGFAYGVDMTDEMLRLARTNAAEAGVSNVEFLKGLIEDLPLPDWAVDVVISNCVINLSTNKPAVFAEIFRVLVPGGRIGLSDVVAEDNLSPTERAKRGTLVGCVAGALARSEYLQGLTAAGFINPSVKFTHEVAPGLHGAIIQASKPSSNSVGR